ncbi:Uma2 family endonuclease [Fusicatenibacter sp.]
MAMLQDEYKKEEKINGVLYDMSPSPSYQHGIVNGNIYRIVSDGLKGSICLAFMENLDYRYHAEKNDDYVIPDVMIACDRKHLKGGSYSGVPKFIVETLSPATAFRDKTEKKKLYQDAGVAEYWIVSPRERAVEIYYLENGVYELRYSYILQDDKEEAHYNADTRITLKEFPHIRMTLAEIFENVD